MSGVSELYQEVIIDHYRQPRNFRKLEGANRTAEGYNPLCGDKVTVYLRVEGGTVREVGFQGSGCALSQASASLMTEGILGRSVREAEELFERFQRLAKGELDGPERERLGKLVIFEGVSRFPMRVKCITLPWHTLRSALQGEDRAASTE